MRWRTLWLTAVLVATTSAKIYLGPDSIDQTPLEIQPQYIPGVVIPDLATGSTNTNEIATMINKNGAASCTNGDDYSDGSSPPKPNSSEENKAVINSTVDPHSTESPIVTSEEDSDLIDSKPAPDINHSESPDDGASDAADESGGQTSEGGDNKDLIVETKSGLIQGFVWKGNEKIISYIDIPYGNFDQPFQAATPAPSWGQNVHEVKEHDKRCPQLDNKEYVGTTDCLTLSIFKPLEAERAGVLFHIHADNFNTGSGDPSIYGPEYLVSHGIILVLPNYRLGPLGFLCMQNATAPGNMAMKDLSLALSWIKENIEAFGGNSDNIAVSGDSKSGALAGFLALSPVSKSYINKVIAESGSFLSYWALDRDPTITAAKLFDNLQETKNAQSRLNISFHQFTVKAIIEAAKGIDFKPCLEADADDAFLTEPPYVTITSGSFENMLFLLGFASYAGIHEALLQTDDSIKKLNEDFGLLLPNDLTFVTATLRNSAGGRIKEQYFGDEAITLEDKKHLSLCYTDIGYLGPGIRSARLLVTANATVYFYEFAYLGEMNRVLESINSPVQGAVRGDIVGYLFTQDGVMPGEESTDSQMVETLIKMWTNFLNTGSPSMDSIKWNKLERTDEDKEEWLLIESQPAMRKGLHVDRLSLWTEIYEKHFIDNVGHELSPSVYTVLIIQLIFWLGFCRNASHLH